MRLKLRVVPNAPKSEIVGSYGEDGALKIKLKAPPVDGKANTELIEFLSKAYKVQKGKIAIISGLTGRNKVVEIEGL